MLLPSPSPFLPILSDWVHLAAAATWVGGLAYFVTRPLRNADADTSRNCEPS